ncbi:MAG TPA: hypothetical protein VLJ17_16880 [Xanthobacteraceae bacterium]|nr:hypothetical protein [Xanthobacteraceae bacterium]
MSIRFAPMSALTLLLATGTAVCGFIRGGDAADLRVLPRHGAEISGAEQYAGNAISGAEAAYASATRGDIPNGSAPAAAAPGHVLAARARFVEARALLERALLLRDRTGKADINALEGHMAALFSELNAVERTRQAGAENVKTALSLAREWREEGMKIVAPPAGGLLELPLPITVVRKAEALSRAIDQLAERPTSRPRVQSAKQDAWQ